MNESLSMKHLITIILFFITIISTAGLWIERVARLESHVYEHGQRITQLEKQFNDMNNNLNEINRKLDVLLYRMDLVEKGKGHE